MFKVGDRVKVKKGTRVFEYFSKNHPKLNEDTGTFVTPTSVLFDSEKNNGPRSYRNFSINDDRYLELAPLTKLEKAMM